MRVIVERKIVSKKPSCAIVDIRSIRLIVFKVLFFLWTELDPGFFSSESVWLQPSELVFHFSSILCLGIVKNPSCFSPLSLAIADGSWRHNVNFREIITTAHAQMTSATDAV